MVNTQMRDPRIGTSEGGYIGMHRGQGKTVNHINPKDQDVKDFIHLPRSLRSVFSIYHHLFIAHHNFRINLFMPLVMPVYAACL